MDGDDILIKNKNIKIDLSFFEIGKNIGRGNFGSVNLVTSKITKNLYAMKTIKKPKKISKEDFKKVEREVKLLENLDNPHVVKYYNSFMENDNFYIIMEFIKGENLEDLIEDNIKNDKLIEEKTLWNYLIQTLNGLLYLHEKKKIIHRDIKPDNLMIDINDNVIITDFGISAVKSEDADSLIRFNNTVTGPKCFMAIEMKKEEPYDFNSDLYMLGMTFLDIMSSQIHENIDFKNLNINLQISRLKNKYSDNLLNFIQKLLLEYPEQRPKTKDAYSEAVIIYSNLYLRSTSICSSIMCLLIIPSFNYFFRDKNIVLKIKNDKEQAKYINLKLFKNAYDNININDFDKEKAFNECLKLRTIMYINDEKKTFAEEINPKEFLVDLLNNLHFELNKYIEKYKGKNNINYDENEEEYSKEEDEDIQNVVKNTIQKFTEEYKSKISELFFYIEKFVYECKMCQKIIKYSCSINNLCDMYPEKAVIYLGKKDLSIIDLFTHYRKKRKYILDENIFCNNCQNKQDKADITKIFYFSPVNLIINLVYSDENNFKLSIDEKINIEDFVERKIQIDYSLVAAIFTEKQANIEKYVSISRNEKGEWLYYNGNSIKKCTLNDLKNHRNVKMLFYSSKIKNN